MFLQTSRFLETSLLIALLGFTMACGGGSEKATEKEPATDEPAASEDQLKTWRLVSYGPQDNPMNVAEGIEVTLRLDLSENKISGLAACNNYFGSILADTETYRFGPLGSTKKMCAEDAVNAMESTYLSMMQKVTGMSFKNGQLILEVEGGQQMTFSAG